MYIQSFPISNNQKQISFHSTRPDKLVCKYKLKPDELEKVSYIADCYEKIMSVYRGMNGSYSTKFKSMYSGLVFGERTKKGFVFESLLGKSGKKLQIARFNNILNSEELLTFRVLEGENGGFTSFRVNNDGLVKVSKTDDVNSLSSNMISKSASKFVPKIIEELEKLREFALHFRKINHQLKSDGSNLFELLKKYVLVSKSSGIKSEIESSVSAYKLLNDTITAAHPRYILSYKQEFMGKDFPSKTKGLIFKNLGKNGETYGFCPLSSKNDLRCFKISVSDRNDKLQNIFVFFSDGSVFMQKPGVTNSDDLRPNCLIKLSDADVENYELKIIMKKLNQKFKEFDEFIKTKRASNRVKNEPAPKIEKQKSIKAPKQLKENPVKGKSVKIPKEPKPVETPKIPKQKVKVQKPVRVIMPSISKVKDSKPPKMKSSDCSVENITRKRIKRLSITDITLNSIVERLANLFSTPVEKRSNHLIHERLSNGNIFSGRFSLLSDDGAKITVSRIKSPKYVEFTYFSIKINKNGKEFVVNIDPVDKKFIKNIEGAKPLIDDLGRVHYITKEQLNSSIPQDMDLVKYLDDIFAEKNDVARQVIKSTSKIRKSSSNTIETEREIFDLLKKFDSDDIN